MVQFIDSVLACGGAATNLCTRGLMGTCRHALLPKKLMNGDVPVLVEVDGLHEVEQRCLDRDHHRDKKAVHFRGRGQNSSYRRIV